MFDEPSFEMRDVLLRECEEFQQLHERHRELDARLNALATSRNPSDSQRSE